ncbi:M48 family metallopeptidase [Nonomuraea jiangxiensis]|uniref:STE24 endopeptidase n=1 Tax=Nonomuraea jiangxiensis TaxID=633440 RepID=A0A1G8H2I0_9ACTN|nr:M48 family metallopeptidase [Nonomuraea jiangxiensis]SDI00882.1 STE24 endopeptidase [Nonomuraea jiangxiensis]
MRERRETDEPSQESAHPGTPPTAVADPTSAHRPRTVGSERPGDDANPAGPQRLPEDTGPTDANRPHDAGGPAAAERSDDGLSPAEGERVPDSGGRPRRTKAMPGTTETQEAGWGHGGGVSVTSGEQDEGAGDRRLRRQAGVALALLAVVLVAVAGFSTPWGVLAAGPPDPARDFTAAQIARAQAFDAMTSLPSYLALIITIVFAVVLVVTPFGAKVLGRLRGPWWLRVILGVVVISLITEALKWPLGMWFETLLRDYGLSTQNWTTWTADRLKSLGVEIFLLSLTLLALVALARKIRRWWIPAAAGAFALVVVASFAYPVVFEPLFNDFTSMRQGPLRTNLLAMAARDGVPVEDVLVADASRRTTALNAYVSGFGATRRIVVYDTLLRAPQPEVELVVAHELGHAKHDDVLYGTLVGGLASALAAIALFLIFGPVRRRAGVTSITDPRAVGALLGLTTLGSLLISPAHNLLSRHIEARADEHSLQITRDPATFIAMQKRLAITNISDLSPDAVEYVLYASHPSSPERIAMARAWAKLNGVPVP